LKDGDLHRCDEETEYDLKEGDMQILIGVYLSFVPLRSIQL